VVDEETGRDVRRAVGAIAFASVLTAGGVVLAVALVIGVAALLGSTAIRLVAGTGDGDVVAQSRLESRAEEFLTDLDPPVGGADLPGWGDGFFTSDEKVTTTVLSVEQGDGGTVAAVVRLIAHVPAREQVGFGDRSWDEGHAESCYRFVALPTGRTLSDVIDCPPR